MSFTFAPEIIELFSQAAIGNVEETITLHLRGRVRFMATTWFARFYQPGSQTEALPGTSVKVIGREGLTLLVVPIDEGVPPGMPSLEHPKTKQLSLSWMQQIGSWFAGWLQ